MSNERRDTRTQDSQSWVGVIIRFIVSAIVIAIAAFLTPGFAIGGLWSVLIAALVITIIDYIIFRIAKFDATPFGRGITGFIVAAVVIYVTQFFVPAMRVTAIGAILGAIVIGLIDIVIPGKTM
ncbi:phage holin family protein [Alkaliphilus peptidifermentans]|uniref:4 TMS phage holin, superfamily IV n=1 Tax=Alkaliphilus peptidifermentans DSM 18978 TaxID=1120976 RepID=A0A1G5IZS1_9FIRM|nr:phage holin family protein [Alkaliphilus peptidifermentans]SCY81404.1 4 TMS phage holin, superfamily IV [Alkaliphilus peptidifermentans DSM 18978]